VGEVAYMYDGLLAGRQAPGRVRGEEGRWVLWYLIVIRRRRGLLLMLMV
jgi:hypothetical protein